MLPKSFHDHYKSCLDLEFHERPDYDAFKNVLEDQKSEFDIVESHKSPQESVDILDFNCSLNPYQLEKSWVSRKQTL